MRVLFVKLGAIGDIVHALPSLAAVRGALPDARISWVVERRSAEVLRENPFIDRLIEIDTRGLRFRAAADEKAAGIRQQARELRTEKYDVALDLQGLLKSGLIAKISGAPRRVGFDRTELREPASRVFLTETAAPAGRVNVIDKNLALACSALGIPRPETYAFPIGTNETHRLEAAAVVERAGPAFAILNPAGGWPTKLWPPESYGELADLLWERRGLASVVSTGPKEAALAARVAAASRSGKCLTVQLGLKGFYELARRAAVYVGGDTGPTHLAVAAGAPVVGIFGPTEWWRNGSLSPDDICVERTDIGCRVDCHRRSCSNWICMDIQVASVLSAVERRLLLAELAPQGAVV